MEDVSGSNNSLVSAPILPSLPELQSANDATALLKTPPPVITPVIPNGIPENIEINHQLQGDYRTGPMPGSKPNNQQNGTLDFVKAAVSSMGSEASTKDQYKYGRTYSYGAGYKNQNFERYYKHNKFDELGFSPYRDNDAVYNEKGSLWDDVSRMQGEWTGLAWGGFKSIWGSEEEANEGMEKGMAIGSSTRGGFGGSVVNFGLNSAYTVGIIGELALEDAALAALEFGTAGGATPLVGAEVARNAMGFGRIVKAWEGTSAFLKSLKTAESAKQFFTAAKAGEKLTDFAKWANPLQRSAEWTTHLAKNSGGVEKLGALAKVSKTFGNYYRDLRELNVAHSEARLEGEGASSEYQNQLVDEYYAKHGHMAEGQDAQDIYDRAQSVKASVTLANDATIYYSNKLVFEDLFQGVRPGSKIAEAFLKGSGNALKRTAAKEFKAGVTAGVEGAVNSLAKVELTGMKKVQNFLTSSVYVPWSRKYMTGNIGEALQENAQETIKSAAHEYYDKIHSDPTQVGFYSVLDAVGKGTGNQFSAQGLETFLSGYMMGSLIQGGGKGIKALGSPFTRGVQAGVYSATSGTYGKEWGSKSEEAIAKEQAEETDNKVLNAGNYILDNAMIYGGHRSDIAAGIKAAAEAKNASAAAGDEKTARDMSSEVQLNQFEILAKTGNMALITNQVDDMLTLNDEDLINAYNKPVNSDGVELTGAQIRTKLQGLKSNAEGYKRAYDKARRLKPNEHNPWMFDPIKEKAAYDDELNKYSAHEQSLADMVFANETYLDIANRMTKMGNELAGNGSMANFFNSQSGGTPIANAVGTDLTVLADAKLLYTHIANLKAQAKVLETGTGEEKKKAGQIKKTLKYLDEWRHLNEAYNKELASNAAAPISENERQVRRRRSDMPAGSIITDRTTGQVLTVAVHTVGAAYSNTLLKDANGQTVNFDPEKHVLTKSSSKIPAEFRGVDYDYASQYLEGMYKVFEKYVRHVAKTKDGYVFDEQVNKGFALLKDFSQLSIDKKRVVHTINKFSDPNMFDRYKAIQVEVQASAKAQKLTRLQKAYEKFDRMRNSNKMLNELFDLGLFVTDTKSLQDFHVTKFYNITAKTELAVTDPKHQQAVDIITKYAEKAGKPVVNETVKVEPVVPAATATTTAPVDIQAQAAEIQKKIEEVHAQHIKDGKSDDDATQLAINSLTPEDRELWIKAKEARLKATEEAEAARAAAAAATATKTAPPKVNTAKVKEYADRIVKGEDRAVVLKGLPVEILEAVDLLVKTLKEINTTGIPLGTARSTAFIKKALYLGFTKDQIKNMSEDHAQEVREANTKADVQHLLDAYAGIEPIHEQDLVNLNDAYDKIQTKQDLLDWKADYSLILSTSTKAYLNKYGVELTAEQGQELYDAKIKELAENKDMDTLTRGTIVILSNKKSVAVVSNNDGETLTLMPLDMFKENFKKDPSTGEWVNKNKTVDETGTITVNKDNVDSAIYMKDSEFKEAMEQPEAPTPEEIVDSNTVIEEVTNNDIGELSTLAADAELMDNEAAKQKAANKFKNCKL